MDKRVRHDLASKQQHSKSERNVLYFEVVLNLNEYISSKKFSFDKIELQNNPPLSFSGWGILK